MGRRIERVARLLLSGEPGPDLILLQEVWFERDAKHIEKALGGTYERIRDSEVVTSHLGWVFGFRRGGLLTFLNGGSRWKVPDTSLFKEYAAHAPTSARGWGLQHHSLGNRPVRKNQECVGRPHRDVPGGVQMRHQHRQERTTKGVD